MPVATTTASRGYLRRLPVVVVVATAPIYPTATECLQTMENDSQKRVPTRRKKAPVAEPKVQRPEWVGYHENYVEKLTVKSFVTR